MSVTHVMPNGRGESENATLCSISASGWRSLPFEVRHFCPNFTRQVFSFAVPFLPLKALCTACPKNPATVSGTQSRIPVPY
jgi:hypothetical protein